HAFFNPKDIPFAAAYVWGLWALLRAVRGDNYCWRSALIFGLLAGACMAVRVGGLLLLCYAGLFILIGLMINWVKIGPLTLRREFAQRIGWGSFASVAAFLVLFMFW